MDHKAALDAGAAVAVSVLVTAAFRVRRRPRLAGALLALTGMTLALAMSADDFLHAWDERYHALVARHLSLHPLLPTLYESHPLPMPQDWLHALVWLHKPPLPLWLMAASLRTLGVSELAVRLPSVALHAACVYATARIGARLLDEQSGLVAAFLVAVNGQLLDLASGRKATDHVDSLLVSFSCLAIWAALAQTDAESRRAPRAALAGALAGLAVLSKWLVGLLPFAVWFAASWGRRDRRLVRDLAIGLLACAAVAGPWELYTRHAFPGAVAVESAHRWQHVVLPLDGHIGTPLFQLVEVPRVFGELSPLALIWFAWRRRGTSAHAPLLVWFALPYAFFAFVATKMAGYVMPAAPAILLVVGAAVVELWRKRRPAAFALAALLVALPVRYTLERWKPLRRFDEERAVARSVRRFVEEEGGGRVLVVGSRYPIESMFYGDVIAIEDVPPETILRPAREEGWRVVAGGP